MADYALYIDDSGHPDDQPYVVAAGFVATEQDWLAFEPEWDAALARHCIGSVFHMTDFMSDTKSVKQRSAVLRDLYAIIRRHTRASFTGAVDVAAYKRVNDEYTLQECLGAPFALAGRGMALEMNKWKSKNMRSGDSLLLFAEKGTKHRGDLAAVFKRDRLPDPHPVEKSLPSVQPADILAWETFKYLRGDERYKRGTQRRIQRLIGGSEEYGSLFTEKDLRDTCVGIRPIVMLRSEISPGDTIKFYSARKQPRTRTIK